MLIKSEIYVLTKVKEPFLFTSTNSHVGAQCTGMKRSKEDEFMNVQFEVS
jgi:hypothetical protein